MATAVTPKPQMRQQAGRLIQTGFARLRATAMAMSATDSNNYQTHLTEVAHQSPNRLIPIRSLAMVRAGACVCALSSYGGGMVQGDSSHVDIHVQPNARLGVVTQGPNRIYYSTAISQRNNDGNVSSLSTSPSCQSITQGRVESNAFLVYAPDHCVPFADSSLKQELLIDLQDSSSSMVLVDWYSAGRIHNGELWHLTRLSSKIKVSINNKLVLVESLALDQAYRGDDCFGFWCDHEAEPLTTFGSVVLHGDQAFPVVQQFHILQEQLASHYTMLRPSSTTTNTEQLLTTTLSVGHFRGRVVVGVSSSSQPGAFMARIAATCTEDFYRVLHYGLQPLGQQFGFEFYKDRLQASHSAPPQPPTTTTTKPARQQPYRSAKPQTYRKPQWNGGCLTSVITNRFLSSKQVDNNQQQCRKLMASSWMSFMLADSSLPTGGFAHSASLEAASQLEWLGQGSHNRHSEAALSAYIQAATRSSVQLQLPLVLAGYLTMRTADDSTTKEKWRMLDDYTHSLLNFNAPACRASLDQGQSLLRIAKLLVQDSQHLQLLEQLQADMVATPTRGHFGPMFGICGAMLLPNNHDDSSSEEELCTLFGYSTGRTMISAAIRLNLIGPMASLPLLAKTEQAAIEGIQAVHDSIHYIIREQSVETPSLEHLLDAAASSAPLVDAIHTCHDLLHTRLFRT